jgi:hypothetical protein
MEKRGQAALEFLMTYGWAILVVLVAIGALAYFGVLRPERLLPEKCVIATGSGLYCDDYSASGTTLTLRLKNLLPDNVNVTAISVTITGETCTDWTGAQIISPDSTADIAITCATFASGDKVKGDLSITYSKAGGLSRTASGQIVTTVS